MGPDEWLQVGCAGRFVPEQGLIVAAAVGAPGRKTTRVLHQELATGDRRALGISAVLGMQLATGNGFSRVQLLLPGPLELSARVRTKSEIPELDDVFTAQLVRCYLLLDIRVVNVVPGADLNLQVAADQLCAEMVGPVRSENGRPGS
jgi:hypothetical protein